MTTVCSLDSPYQTPPWPREHAVTGTPCTRLVAWSERTVSTPDDVQIVDPFRRSRSTYLVGVWAHSFGFGLMSLASYLVVYDQTKSVAATGLIVVAMSVPQFCLPVVATRCTERWGGLAVYFWSTLLSGLITLLPVGLALTGSLTPATLLLFYVALGVTFGIGASSALLVRITLAAPGKLPELNGNRNVAWAIAMAMGYLLGSFAYSLLGVTWIFIFAAVSYVPSVLAVRPLLRQVPVTAPTSREKTRDVVKVWKENGRIRASMVLTLMCFAVGGYSVVLPALARTISSNNFVLSSLEATTVLGGLAVTAMIKRVSPDKGWFPAIRRQNFLVMSSLFLLALVAFVETSAVHHHVVLLILSVVAAHAAILGAGVGLNFNGTVLATMVMASTGDKDRNGVLAAYNLIPLLAVPIGQEVIGLVADQVSLAAGIALPALVVLVWVRVFPRTNLRREFESVLSKEPEGQAQSHPVGVGSRTTR